MTRRRRKGITTMIDEDVTDAVDQSETAAVVHAEAKPEKVLIVNKYGATALVLKTGLAKWLKLGGQGWKLADDSTTSNNGVN